MNFDGMRVFPDNVLCLPSKAEQVTTIKPGDLWETAARSKDEMMRCQIKVRAS